MDFETATMLLGDDCQRAVVEILRDDGPISRRHLSDRLAARSVEAHGESENDASDPAKRYRLQVALHHDHLPRLADAGLIEYDDEKVAPTPELEPFVSWYGHLDRDPESTEDSGPPEDAESMDDLRDRLMAFYA